MTTSQTSTIIEREVHIDASPETVYRFFIDPEQFVRWMGRKAEIDARPGGLLRLDYNGFDIMRGSIVEFEENRRVVITWGFETLGDAPAPGSTRVEMTLTPEAGGTRLRLVHSGLDEASAEAHRGGWDHFLEMLRQQAAGAPAPEPVTLSESEEMASKLNTLLVNVRWAIESCPANRWTTPTPNDGRQVNQVANHIVGHLFLADFAAATARGERAPAADFTGEMLEGFNAQAAKESTAITQAEVLAALKRDGPKAVETVKALTAEGLDRTQPMRFAGGAELSARQIVQGPLLADIAGHLESMRAAS